MDRDNIPSHVTQTANYYLQNSNATLVSAQTTTAGWIYNLQGEAGWGNQYTQGSISVNFEKHGIHPVLAFKFIKKKFGILEGVIIKRRLDKLEKAAYQAIENGQEVLADKFIRELSRETRESVLYAKGIRHFVERADVMKVKNNIKGGHISDTLYKDFTRVIPKDVIEKKKKVEDCFDGFVIYHYYDKEVEKKLAKKQKMTPDEERKMKDPILFGIIKETDRLYFIADWEDEYCDLTFDEIVDVVGENKLTKYPEIHV